MKCNITAVALLATITLGSNTGLSADLLDRMFGRGNCGSCGSTAVIESDCGCSQDVSPQPTNQPAGDCGCESAPVESTLVQSCDGQPQPSQIQRSTSWRSLFRRQRLQSDCGGVPAEPAPASDCGCGAEVSTNQSIQPADDCGCEAVAAEPCTTEQVVAEPCGCEKRQGTALRRLRIPQRSKSDCGCGSATTEATTAEGCGCTSASIVNPTPVDHVRAITQPTPVTTADCGCSGQVAAGDCGCVSGCGSANQTSSRRLSLLDRLRGNRVARERDGSLVGCNTCGVNAGFTSHHDGVISSGCSTCNSCGAIASLPAAPALVNPFARKKDENAQPAVAATTSDESLGSAGQEVVTPKVTSPTNDVKTKVETLKKSVAPVVDPSAFLSPADAVNKAVVSR